MRQGYDPEFGYAELHAGRGGTAWDRWSRGGRLLLIRASVAGGSPERPCAGQALSAVSSSPTRILTTFGVTASVVRTLFIGEDSSKHVNNFLWAYNVDTKQLARIMSIPAGGESTGLHAVDEINGWTYITTNFQHAGDWLPNLHGKVKPVLDPLVRANYKDRFGAAVGYLTGVPATAK